MTVVIPCYNYARYLRDCVASALAQPGLDIRVIVVDDASTDGSRSVALEIASQDTRVRLLVNASNLGHIATYNRGLLAADGDYLVLLSADDLLTPGSLSRAVALMEHFPSVGLTFGKPVRFSETPPLVEATSERWYFWQGADWLKRRAQTASNAILCPEAVLRASVYREIGPYRADLPHSADMALWLRAASVADVGFVSGPCQALYREHGSNMHSEIFGADQDHGMVTDLEERRRAIQTSLDGVRDGDALVRLSCKALATEALRLASRAYVWGLVDRWPVDQLIAFAERVDPQAREGRAWRALARRQRLGPRYARRNPLFLPAEYFYKAMYSRQRRDRERVGS